MIKALAAASAKGLRAAAMRLCVDRLISNSSKGSSLSRPAAECITVCCIMCSTHMLLSVDCLGHSDSEKCRAQVEVAVAAHSSGAVERCQHTAVQLAVWWISGAYAVAASCGAFQSRQITRTLVIHLIMQVSIYVHVTCHMSSP
jgi:hypothetical protein